jgi:hypothetical protein
MLTNADIVWLQAALAAVRARHQSKSSFGGAERSAFTALEQRGAPKLCERQAARVAATHD